MSKGITGFDPLGWQVLSVVGLCLVVAGAADLGLGLFPLRFGNPEWEFGSISNLLNRLPLVGLGLALVLVASLARRAVAATYVWSSILLLVAIVVFVFGLLYGTNLPLVLASLSEGTARSLLQKAIVKTVAQVVIFFVGFFIVAVYGVRTAGKLRPR